MDYLKEALGLYGVPMRINFVITKKRRAAYVDVTPNTHEICIQGS